MVAAGRNRYWLARRVQGTGGFEAAALANTGFSWSNGSGASIGVSGPDAPYTGSAIYYPPQPHRAKPTSENDSQTPGDDSTKKPAKTAEARLPRVIYGIQPDWGPSPQGPRVIDTSPVLP